MVKKSQAFDLKNTSSKEVIRKNIRHALSSKSANTFPNIDLSAELFHRMKDPFEEFVVNFRKAGGKYIPCSKENLMDRLVQLLQNQNYRSVLNTNHSLSNHLTNNNIPYVTSIHDHTTVDAAIIYADTLIAISGSMVFSQKYSLYPSIKNIANDFIVVAFKNSIVPDLKNALSSQKEKNNDMLYDFFEIITPTLPEVINNQEMYSPNTPRFILLLVS